MDATLGLTRALPRLILLGLLLVSFAGPRAGVALGSGTDGENAAVERSLLRALQASMPEEDRLRAIDLLVERQATSLAVRSALRRCSLDDPSAEVRGAARFALVKLQSIAPPIAETPALVQTASNDPADRVRQWSPKESVEEIAEPAIDDQVVQTGGTGSNRRQPRLRRRSSSDEVTVFEMASDETQVPSAVAHDVAIPELPAPSAEPTVSEVAPEPERTLPRTLPPVTKSEESATHSNLADRIKAWRVVRKPTPEEMMNGFASDAPTVPANEIPVPTLVHEVEPKMHEVLQPAPAPAPEPTHVGHQPPPVVPEPVPVAPAPMPQEVPPVPAHIVQASPSVPAEPVIPTPDPATASAEFPPVDPQPAPSAPVASTIGNVMPTVPRTSARPIPRAADVPVHTAQKPANLPQAVPQAGAAPPPHVAHGVDTPTAPAAIPANHAKPWASTTAEEKEDPPATTAVSEPPQSEKTPRLALNQIPRSDADRKRMAKEMLEQARQSVVAGEISEAESILFQVRELAVQYGLFQYSPDDLERELAEARAGRFRQEQTAQSDTRLGWFRR